MTLTPTNARIAPTAVITAAGALAAYELALATGAPEAYQAAADQLADVVRRGAHKKPAKPVSAPKAKKAKTEETAAPTGVFNAQNFYAALVRVRAAMDIKRYTIPILQYVRLVVADGRLRITGTDLDMDAIETLTDCDAPEMDVCVEAERLIKALQGARGGVKIEPTVTKVLFHIGGVVNSFTPLLAGDMPTPPEQLVQASFSISVQDLREKLRFVQPGVSTEETRYYLNGVWTTIERVDGEPMLVMVSTDGHRLFRDATPAPHVSGDLSLVEKGVIIPNKAIGWLLKNMPKSGEIRVVYSKHKTEGENLSPQPRIGFEFDSSIMLTKVIDGSYPDYARVIPREYKTVVTIADVGAVRETVAKVSSILKEKSKAISLDVHRQGVKVACKNHEGAEANADLPAVKVDGVAVKVGLNAAYLVDGLGKSGAVDLMIDEDNSPLRIGWKDAPGRIAVLMPLRL